MAYVTHACKADHCNNLNLLLHPRQNVYFKEYEILLEINKNWENIFLPLLFSSTDCNVCIYIYNCDPK